MLQITFQFKTYTPTGNAMAALGTGHVSLEPTFLAALKLTPTTYLQGQFGNWIPLGGTSGQAGGIFLSYMSLNQVLYEFTPSSPLIATLEMDVWSFENGGYTNPIAKTPSGAATPTIHTSGGGVSYFNIGPGLRQSICNKMDIGGALDLGDEHAPLGRSLVPVRGPIPVLSESNRPVPHLNSRDQPKRSKRHREHGGPQRPPCSSLFSDPKVNRATKPFRTRLCFSLRFAAPIRVQ